MTDPLLQLVRSAARANPFGQERAWLDLRLTGANADTPRTEILDRVQATVSRALRPFKTLALSSLPAREQPIVEHAIVFAVFHRLAPALDTFIDAETAGDTPRVASFADTLVSELADYGIAESRALRYVPLLYQMRRAFLLIDRTLPGQAACMQSLRVALWDALFTSDLERYEGQLAHRMEDFSVLLLGETGTGKGVAARALGQSGWIPYDADTRRFQHLPQDAYTPINLSSYAEGLVPSELFGHAKGAFTGAHTQHVGVLERCIQHGIAFLDEVGDVSPQLQVALLRVLQEREFTPVGSRDVRRFRGRVIAATHRDLDLARLEERFRDDFYYRLSTTTIVLPTLRERLSEAPDELSLLVGQILERVLSPADAEVVAWVTHTIASGRNEHQWPGNVRELEQVVRHVLLRGDVAPTPSQSPKAMTFGDEPVPARSLMESYCAYWYERLESYEAVARQLELDRRTVKKYVDGHMEQRLSRARERTARNLYGS